MIAALALAAAAAHAAQPPIRGELAPLAFLVGHCWVGKSPAGTPDTHCFSTVYGGKHVRDRHIVPGTPPYRGETLYSWNATAKRIEYAYWNSLGDVYCGVASPVADGLDFTDMTTGIPVIIRWRRMSRDSYVVEATGRPVIRFVLQRSAAMSEYRHNRQ